MTDFADDVRYAYVRMGLEIGADADHVGYVVRDASVYRYATAERKILVRRMADFLHQRQQFGGPDLTFSEIRKGYYRRAMLLHPDRTFGNKASEDELKAVTTAYNLVDQVHREALEFFQKPGPEQDRIAAAARRERENEARARTGKPRHIPPEPAPEDDDTAEPAPSPVPETAAGTIRYFAASVPRYIRNARLFYLSRDAIIGSRLVKNNSGGLVYDIIMLPEPEFMRAKLYLSLAVGQTSSLELTMSKITPAYSPVDTKFLRLPLDEPDPYRRARAYFVAQFGLDQTTSS